jgi:pimeloyl-ACP methyl ester carboxylesterase
MLSEDTAVTERRVEGSGVSLAVFERGDPTNPTVVLVHGFPDTSAMWTPVAERLADRFHVVAYDVRGAGGSTVPSRRFDYLMERLVEDMAAVIDAVSPGAPVHLVGHDWGSIQSWEAVCHPHMERRIASYTSISGPSLEHASRWVRERLRRPTPRALLQLFRQALRSWYITMFRIPGVKWMWRHHAHRFRRYLELVEEVTPSDDYPAVSLGEDAAHAVDLYRANMSERMRFPRHRRTNVPVQVIVPIRDRHVSPALLDGIDRIAPKLTRRDIDAPHWAPRTHPDLIATLIAEFALGHAQEAA